MRADRQRRRRDPGAARARRTQAASGACLPDAARTATRLPRARRNAGVLVTRRAGRAAQRCPRTAGPRRLDSRRKVGSAPPISTLARVHRPCGSGSRQTCHSRRQVRPGRFDLTIMLHDLKVALNTRLRPLTHDLALGTELGAAPFAALDFETATASRASACSVGVALVDDGAVTARPQLAGAPAGATNTRGSTRRSTASSRSRPQMRHRSRRSGRRSRRCSLAAPSSRTTPRSTSAFCAPRLAQASNARRCATPAPCGSHASPGQAEPPTGSGTSATRCESSSALTRRTTTRSPRRRSRWPAAAACAPRPSMRRATRSASRPARPERCQERPPRRDLQQDANHGPDLRNPGRPGETHGDKCRTRGFRTNQRVRERHRPVHRDRQADRDRPGRRAARRRCRRARGG